MTAVWGISNQIDSKDADIEQKNSGSRDFYFNSMYILAVLYQGKPNGCPTISQIGNTCLSSVAHNINPIMKLHET